MSAYRERAKQLSRRQWRRPVTGTKTAFAHWHSPFFLKKRAKARARRKARRATRQKMR
jgi:hypothetical protein